MSDARTTEDYLREADDICRELKGTVRYEAASRYDPSTASSQTYYRVFRRGMGRIASPGSAEALVRYLRKQRPPARGSSQT